ncbi:hypothetical protein [Marinicella sp. W31]|uniref:hypothetical protein n=1 Tax=Marinicella sp. W31 TaxID=3023713 RepID=UPI0037567954
MMSVVAFPASTQMCDLKVMEKHTRLEHIYVFEQPNWLKPEQTDMVIFCIQESLQKDQQNIDEITTGLSAQRLHGIKIVIEPTGKRITEISLKWHNNTIAMISGILSTAAFDGQIIGKKISGEIKSLETFTAQKSKLINNELMTENVPWDFKVLLDHIIRTDPKEIPQ